MRSKLLMMVPVFAGLTMVGTGCVVSQSKHEELNKLYLRNQELNVELEDRNTTLQRQISDAQTRLDALKGELEGNSQLTSARIQELNEMISSLQNTKASLEAERAELEASNAQLIKENRILATQGPIDDPVLNDALRDYAAKNGDLVEFDNRLGMVKLKSDLTFSPGSADLTPEAVTALAELAEILNTPAAKKFELRIVGHTDDTPVVKAETKKKFGNNWMLSVFRANSVRSEMRKDGISSKRMMIAGYGPYRPVAPANTAGRAKNRRVELYLVPLTSSKYHIADPKPKTTAAAPAAGPRVEKEDLSQYK